MLDYLDSNELDGFARDAGDKFKAALEYKYLELKGPRHPLLPRVEDILGALSGALVVLGRSAAKVRPTL